MKEYLLYMVLILFTIQMAHSQESGIVSLDIPVRNSLKFNRYLIDPTFSFVREQNKYVTIYNKREFVQFDDAPQTYLASYSGRFSENSGIGVGLFQQNYGVLTTFGGVLNYAYNVKLNRESNLTFGMNLGIYKSGLNNGKVITNYPDPSLDNVPSNTLIAINPGINYGTTFFDFGLSINNLVLYNLKTSKMIEEDPGQSIQAHIMYTGFMDSRGFFDQARFSGLIRSEFGKDNTTISGIAMIAVPKGIWAQAGYNSLYGMSAGIGLNISEQISIEYNYEKAMGDITTFGSSHEITLAYKFKKTEKFDYSDNEEEEALIFSNDRSRSTVSKGKSPKKPTASGKEKAKLAAASRADAQVEKEERQKAAAEAKAYEEEMKAIQNEEAILQAEVDAQLKADEEARQKEEEVSRLKAEEAKAIADQEAKQKVEAEAKLKAENEAKLKVEREAKAKAEREARQKALEAKAIADEEARLKAENEAKLKAEAEVQAKAEAEARQKEEEISRLKAEEEKAIAEEARIKAETVTQEETDFVPAEWTTGSMGDISKFTEENRQTQQELLKRLEDAVASKERDLIEMKEENDLSEQGIYVEPKPFKSLTAENVALESLKVEIDNAIKTQENKITEFENLYNERFRNVPDPTDSSNIFYQKKIEELKSDQQNTINTKAQLESKLADINVATEVERKRRIRRAAYDNEQDRYTKDRMVLNQIKTTTALSNVPLKAEDFDFGEEQSGNIQIIKDVKNTQNGFYVVIAVHNDVEKRNEFLSKVVASGQSDVDFFYDVNSSKYFIYYEKFDSVQEANNALEARGSKPFNGNMSIVKIEN